MKSEKLFLIINSLRLIGIINSFSLATYMLFTSYAILPFKAANIEQIYMGIAVLTVSSAILIINILKDLRPRFRGTWIADAIAATLIIAVLIYFSFISSPRILGWFTPLGFLLPAPVLLSAIFSFIRKKSNKSFN